MAQKWKRPGNALQRVTGAENGSQLESTTLNGTYAKTRKIQRRYLERRWGLGPHSADLIAGLCFGEDC